MECAARAPTAPPDDRHPRGRTLPPRAAPCTDGYVQSRSDHGEVNHSARYPHSHHRGDAKVLWSEHHPAEPVGCRLAQRTWSSRHSGGSVLAELGREDCEECGRIVYETGTRHMIEAAVLRSGASRVDEFLTTLEKSRKSKDPTASQTSSWSSRTTPTTRRQSRDPAGAQRSTRRHPRAGARRRGPAVLRGRRH